MRVESMALEYPKLYLKSLECATNIVENHLYMSSIFRHVTLLN